MNTDLFKPAPEEDPPVAGERFAQAVAALQGHPIPDPASGEAWVKAENPALGMRSLPLASDTLSEEPPSPPLYAVGAPQKPRSIRDIQARRRASAEVYPEEPGLFRIEYLPTQVADPALVRRLEDAQGGDGEGDPIAMLAIMEEYCTKVLYSWNLAEPCTPEAVKALGPIILMDVINAIRQEAQAGNAAGPSITSS